MISLNVNQKDYQVDVDSNMPLLWVIRDIIGLDRNKIWLRGRTVRSLYGAPEWRSGTFLCDKSEPGPGTKNCYD